MKVRNIPGHRPYKATDRGDVIRAGKVLRPGRSSNGYMTVRLYKNGVGKSFLVHRLILKTFRGSAPDGYTANHKDFDRANNAIDNLEWTTPKQNAKHARQPVWHRTQTALPGFKNYCTT